MNRSLLVLLGVAGLLVLVVLLVANPFRDSIHTERSTETLLAADAATGIDRVVLTHTGKRTELARRPEGWVVASEGNFAADTAAVGTLLRSVRAATFQGIASTNPENRSKFEVDTTGVQVELSAGGNPVAAFVVGKGGTDFTTSYLRLEGEDAVRVVRGVNRNMFTRPQGFRDRTILAADPATLRFLQASGAVAWTLSRSDTGWVAGGSAEELAFAAQPVAEQIVRSVAALNADGFQDALPDTLDTGLEAPYATLDVKSADGREWTLTLGALSDANQRFVKVSPGPDAVFLLGDWRVSGLLKPLDELLGEGANP